jgi:hypothetical protein
MYDSGYFVIAWESYGQDGSGYGVYAQRYNASGTTQGSEFLVNTHTTGAQRDPSTAVDADGDFVIAWESGGQDGSDVGVYAQRHNSSGTAQGSEFKVNSHTTGQQSSPSAAMNSAGDFLIVWESDAQDGSSFGVYGQRYNSSGAAQDNEFQVNTYTAAGQFSAAVGMESSGDFVVLWESNGQDSGTNGIYGQDFTVSLGSEFQVNTYTDSIQAKAVTAMDADGNFVVVWASEVQDGDGMGIYAQRYNALGVAQGAEFRINTYTTGWQDSPSVAMADDGAFVIAWESGGQDGGADFGIFAQRYNASGTAQGSEFQVNTWTLGRQINASVAMDSDGDFVIAWQSYGAEGNNSYGIFAQRYNASGTAQASEFQVNTHTTGNQQYPSAAMDDSGDLVIAWESYNQDGAGYGVYAQRYNSSGTAQGSEFLVNSYTTGNQMSPSVAVDAGGEFVIAWSGDGAGDSSGVFAQRYNASGTAQGSEFLVNMYTTSVQAAPIVAMDATGDFVIAWQSRGQDGGGYGSYGDSDGVYARRYNASGTAQGAEFQVNTYTTGDQSQASVAISADGDFLVVWESGYGQDGNQGGIYGQRFG